jgi:hypothetical protein
VITAQSAQSPAEPMSREAYAANVRHRPAADFGQDIGHENRGGLVDEPGNAYHSCWTDPAETPADGSERGEACA